METTEEAEAKTKRERPDNDDDDETEATQEKEEEATLPDSEQDLFPDSEDLDMLQATENVVASQQEDAAAAAVAEKEDRSFSGIPLADLATYDRFPEPDPSHDTVLVSWPKTGDAFAPHPDPLRARDLWDERHVRMPCSKDSVFPAKGEGTDANRRVLKQRYVAQKDNFHSAFHHPNDSHLQVDVNSGRLRSRFNTFYQRPGVRHHAVQHGQRVRLLRSTSCV